MKRTATGEMIPGTVQQSTIIIHGPFINHGDRPNIGGIENYRNEENKGAQASSYSMEMKIYYSTSLCKASPLPWYPEYTWDIDEVYTELALQNSATSKFGVEGLFEQWDKHYPKGGTYRILIEGDAGYGKSTLMLKIASDWSNSKDYTSRFSLLFVVKLGHVGEDGQISSYMDSIYEEKMGKKVKDLLKSKGAEILVLLDGYDEANAKTKEEVDRIMTKETMSKCHVVLTSRCGHVPDDVKCHALLVRVTGFGPRQVAVAVGKFFIKAGRLTKDEVRNCIDKPVPPSIDDFKNVQEKDPLIDQRLSLEQFNEFMEKLGAESPYKELAQCPLLCVMLCCLVSDSPNELPSTVSGLYFAMINGNIYRAKRKKAAGKVRNLSILQNRITTDHEVYLQEFGGLCIKGLKTRSMSFTLFDITGNEEDAETTDVKVTQLVEAGVLVQDTKLITNQKIPRYQVPHRTTAEFLAAYCLSSETDQNSFQQNLLDLYRLSASFDEVAASLIEMGKTRCLADALCGIKFPFYCLISMPFMISYFTRHGAAATWMEFKDVLPNKLQIVYKSNIVTVSSATPNETLLHLCEVLGKGNTRETDARPSDCLVSVHVDDDFNPELLQALSKSGVGLYRLDLNGKFKTSKSVREKSTISDLARILQELLKSHSCPVHLKFPSNSNLDYVVALTEAMQEVPEGCRLKRFDFIPDVSYAGDTSRLEEVLAEKWLSHLQHLGLTGGIPKPILKRLREPGCSLTSLHLEHKLHIEDLTMLASKLETLSLQGVNYLYFDVTEISKYAVKERCSLKRLHLTGVSLHLKGSLPSADENQELLLAWRNVALHLEELTIDNCKFPIELFSWLKLSLPNLRTVTIGTIYRVAHGSIQCYANQVLEALTRSSGDSIEELSLLRGFFELGYAVNLHPKQEAHEGWPWMKRKKSWYDNLGCNRSYLTSADPILSDPSTHSSFSQFSTHCEFGLSIAELQYRSAFSEQQREQSQIRELKLHPIREALQRCPRMKSVNLGYSLSYFKSKVSIGRDPSTLLSPSDEEALKSDNNYYALLKIVLSVPELQTLTSGYFFDKWEEIGTFHAIADKAEKWPGKTNENDCNTSLTLHDLSNWDAINAMHVFRERGLEYRLRYVSDRVYELWFPPRVVIETQFQGV